MGKQEKQTDELKALQNQIAELQEQNAKLAEANSKVAGNSLEDIRRAARRGRKDATTITVREFKDYVPIRLYHVSGANYGKLVGPMHPDGAEDAFMRFASKGITLSINKPTAEQIEAYRNDPKNAEIFGKEVKRRESRNRSRKESEVDRLTKAVGSLAGSRITNTIKDRSEVK